MSSITREELWINDKPHEPILEEGMHDVVIDTVEDLGEVDTGRFGVKDMVKVTYIEKGTNKELPKRYNKSLHPKSALHDLVYKATGAAPTRPFNAKILEGKELQILTEHSKPSESGDVWDHVVNVLRPKQPNFKDNFEEADN
jgi:hypothetical protein